MTRRRLLTYGACVGSFLVGALLGPGFIWSYAQSQRDADRLELEKTTAVSQLSIELNELYDEIVSLSDKYMRELTDYHLSRNGRLLKEMGEDSVKLATLKDAYRAVEAQLAGLLGREPKPLSIDFIPPAPIEGLKMEVAEPRQ